MFFWSKLFYDSFAFIFNLNPCHLHNFNVSNSAAKSVRESERIYTHTETRRCGIGELQDTSGTE